MASNSIDASGGGIKALGAVLARQVLQLSTACQLLLEGDEVASGPVDRLSSRGVETPEIIGQLAEELDGGHLLGWASGGRRWDQGLATEANEDGLLGYEHGRVSSEWCLL